MGSKVALADDTTPDITAASYFTMPAVTGDVTAFDGDVAGQIWVVEHTGAAVFDCDNSGAASPTLQCGAGNTITTAAGDLTTWISDGTNEILLNWMDESATQAGADLAEWFPANEDVQSGDVLVAAGFPEHVEKSVSSYQKGLIGVVSTQPGLILGEESQTFSALVALS